ncbi:LmbE-like protein [Pseudovirgaria hyperparasitica]|uniref:N-acetylglucosaminylphosphatidylinositol deacetylase n=1 Tax=Pseudovirgaria hyperparasitica TaxID=470096 RepID=A0A6A6WKG4_9PEZI|nr:LmbE-like protein [Pseudovirgaria hyperparasitica]KAF2762646.1 LmbE-like protein [Pseudovirgaria hyperparasitica]
MDWIPLALFPVFVFGIWLFTSQITRSFPPVQGKRIVLLIAHPDDEAMFFAPTVQELTRPELGNHLKILCLSTGNADGLGETRKKELAKSGLLLGLRGADDILCIDDPNFPDSMTTTWHPRLISNLLTGLFAPKMASIPPNKKPETTVDIIITFDKGGVSSHPNHISLYNGAQSFLKGLMHRHAGWDCPIKLYTLTSISIFRKYLSILDAPTTMFWALFTRKDKSDSPSPLIYCSGLQAYVNARKAMTVAHKSQMVWFRWGWISAGRYMVLNDLRKARVV